MARYHFDRSGAGVILGDAAGDLTPLKNLTGIPVYVSESGGAPVTDLASDPAGALPVTTARTDALGRVSFYGPDGVRGPLWVELAGVRYAVLSVAGLGEALDAAAQIPGLAAAAATAAASAQAAQVAASVGLGPVVSGSFVGPPEGQPGPTPTLTWTIASSPIGLRADGVEYYQPSGVTAADRAVLWYSAALGKWVARRLVSSAAPAGDVTPPVVTGETLTAASTTASFTAVTNETAVLTVQYGATTAYGSSVVSTSGTAHSVTLTGLTVGGTTYHYRYRAVDTAGNASAWTGDATFTTSAAPSAALTVPNQTPTGTFAWTAPALTTTDLSSADMWGQTTFAGVSTLDYNAGIVLRSNAAGTQYLRASVSKTRWKIEHIGITVPTDYNEAWITGPGADNAGVLRAEIIGRVLTIYIDGSPIMTPVTLDAAVTGMTGRRAGVQTYQNTAAVTLNNNQFSVTAGSAAPASGGTTPAVGQPGYKAYQVYGATRSGLPWHSGMWAGGVKTLTRQNAVDTWRTRPGDVFEVKPDDTSWATMVNSDWAIGDLDGYPGVCVYWLPLLPKDRAGQWADVTGGANDAVFTTIANQLKAHQRGNALVMLAPEANIGYQAHNVTWATAASYKAAFQRVYGLLHSAAPNVKVAQCFAGGYSLQGKPAGTSRTGDLDQMYAGAAYVDLIEITHADANNTIAQNDTQWSNVLRPSTGPGLQDVADYAAAKGKGLVVGRWGLSGAQGPGDNPYLIGKMWDWLNTGTIAANLVAELYYNEPDPSVNAGIVATLENQNPNSGAAYKAPSRWGV